MNISKDLKWDKRYYFMKKKGITCLVIIGLLLLIIPPSESINKSMVTFVKYMPDGKTETFCINVECSEGYTMSECITQKCKDLVEKDENIQNYVDSKTGLYIIISMGNGLHFSLPSSYLQSTFWDIYFSFFPSIMYCSYSDDEAKTDIFSLTSTDNSTLLKGEHRVLCIGFVGIIGWRGIFSSGDTGFAGFSPFIWND